MLKTPDEDGLRHLLPGDRLEPSDNLQDVGALDFLEATELPLELTFWRTKEQTLALHRTPLWDPELGTTPSRVLVPDWLHGLSKGVIGYALGFLLHRLVEKRVADQW